MPQKALSKIWILIIVAVIIVAAGVLVWWRLWTSTEVEQPPADETVNWKTYRNEEYWFEVNYPSTLRVFDEKILNERFIGFQPVDYVGAGFTPMIAINADVGYSTLLPKDLAQAVREMLQQEVVITEKVLTIKNYNVYRAEENYKEMGIIYDKVYISNGKKVVIVSFTKKNKIQDNSPYQDIFEQILSTFRFLE